MPCVLRRDPSIILSTKQAQDLTRCCSGSSMSLSQPADPSFTSTPPASSTSASAELVARIEEWLYKEDPVLPTSFVDLPRINSVVYPLTTANLWYLQGILNSKEVSPPVPGLKWSIHLSDSLGDTYSASMEISYLVLDLTSKSKSKAMQLQGGRERAKDVSGDGCKEENPRRDSGTVVLDHACDSRRPGRLISHGTD